MSDKDERCSVCGCRLHRGGNQYAKPTIKGRSHATKHHFVAERFFGRSANRKKEQREKVFEKCPWGVEGQTETFCYECHEELLHNPVFLADDIERFAELVRHRRLDEGQKTASRDKLAERIKLLHEVIREGLQVVLNMERKDGG